MQLSNWIFSKRYDLICLFVPVWGVWLVMFLLPPAWITLELPLWVWVIFVLGIDVSHVWSTLFRTYLDREEYQQHRKLLILAPVLAFLGAAILSAISMSLFWRVLAYVAVFHFVKQQYGFMRIYKAKARDFKQQWISDNFVIYLSMIYPIVFWHLNLDRQFSWFISGDFIQWQPEFIATINFTGSWLYFLTIGLWLVQEVYRSKGMSFPTGKVLWVLTTAGNWYIGIVYFNSDLVFTITNVVAHGIPYLALVLFYQQRKFQLKSLQIGKFKYALMVITGVFLLALGEEYFWDLLVSKENGEFFAAFLPYFEELPALHWQVLATAVLSVPQITHYIVDGYIWKNNEKNPYLKEALMN